MFERFTDRARRVVVLAHEEARLLRHHYIGTEHILLGLINEGQGLAAQALESLGVSLHAARAEVRETVGEGKKAPAGHIPFTPQAKKVLELSLREALHLGHNYIGTEHILLGLLREGDGVAVQVLVRLGVDLNDVRRSVIRLLRGGQSAEYSERAASEVPSVPLTAAAEPGKSAEPRKSAEPGEAAEPGESGEPSEPGEPGELREPAAPGEPGEPGELREPAEPGEPTEPTESGGS